MVSIIFIWEISQELSEPYQSAITKVITCKDAVSAFISFIPGIRVKSHYLDQTSLKFVVCWIFLFSFFFKKNVMGNWAQAKTKSWERKVPVIPCCEILYQVLADCDRTERAKGKAAWFFVCVDLWIVLNVAASKSQSWTKEILIF